MHYSERIDIMFRNNRRCVIATVLPLVALLQGCQQQSYKLDEETHAPQRVAQERPLPRPTAFPKTEDVGTTSTVLVSTQFSDDRTAREHDLTTQLFTAWSGQQIKFSPMANRWYAMIYATPNDRVPQRTLPVVGPPDIGVFLASLQKQDLNAEKARIHIVDTPSRSCVYLGKYGLAGGSKKTKFKKRGAPAQAAPAPVAEDTPEIARLKENLERQEKALAHSRQIHKNQPHTELAVLLHDVGMAYVTLGNLNKGLVCLEQALEMYQVLYLDNEEVFQDLIRVLGNLGNTYMCLGKSREGLGYKEQAISVCHERYQDLDQPLELAELLDAVVADYCALGNFRKAMIYARRALDIKKACYKNAPHPGLINALNILGQTHNALQEFREGLKCFEEALALGRVLYKDHPNLAHSLYDVGMSYYNLYEYHEAIAHFEQALAIRKAFYKEQPNPEVADSWESVGMISYALSDYHKALECFEQSFTVRSTVYEGCPHPKTADSLESIGMSYNALRDYHRALEYFGQALAIRKALYEKDLHPKLADAFNNMGVAYENLSDFHKSAEYFEHFLNVCRALYKDTPDPKLAGALYNLGNAYVALCDPAHNGLDYGKQSLAMRKILYGDDPHPETASSIELVGHAHAALGEYSEALEYYNQALTMCQSLYKDSNHDVARCLCNVSRVCRPLDRPEEEMRAGMLALEICKALHEDFPHPTLALALSCVSGATSTLGNFVKSIEYSECALTVYQQLYEDYPHPEMARCLCCLSTTHNLLGNFQKGLEYGEKSLLMYQTLYQGRPHLNMALSLDSIGDSYRGLGELKEGARYKDEAIAIREQLHGGL
jgi:tetratricopeptide (TPR) repeat protein